MRKRGSKIVFQFIAVFCALSFVPFLYFYTQLSLVDQQTEQYVEQLNRNKLEYSKVELQTSLQKISTSLRYLSNNGVLNQAILKPTRENLDALEEFWLLIARTQGYYSQLRFIDQDGMEVVRINSGERFIEIVEPERLQFKGDRDYFAFAKTLGDHDTGNFGIDLEVENGNLVTPHQPAYRVIYPITLNGERKGYFVANLDLARLYYGLAYKRNQLNLPIVATGDGYYLMSTNGEKILGNLLDAHRDSKISQQFPQLWRSLQFDKFGTVKERDYWISYTTAELNDVEHVEELIFFIKTSLDEAHAFTDDARHDLYIQAAFILIILFLLTFTFVTWNHNHEKNSLDSKIARAAMNGMSAVVITDRNNRIIQVNSEFTRISGYTLEDVKGRPPSLFASGKHLQEFYMNMWKILEEKGLWEGEVVNKRRDGSLITEILRIQTVKDRFGVIQFYVASFVDISHRKELEDRLRELSEKDPMTSLWNRRKFDKEMQNQAMRTKRYSDNESATLALIDIDHFKRVNDNYGHDRGDEVIKDVAGCLTHHLRETDVIARIGGEEFAIIMPHTDLREAEMVLNRVRTAINIESELNITVSAGATEISAKPEETYKRADIALYESKSLGRNQVSILSVSETHSIA
ncbi:diguanylate cyclase [Vibrio tubiashii]|uniref:sensor domain-containing diguanylate cyclase n=1 Tax=Vibrio tubiashii TaxID=29498 RepID=UPI001EFCDA23|nr:diguanylate cyclase [Vibrio tubiashii]MCG9580696.1 diguanylate cyclase [Vibrio tubiashii]MCG9614287.1 diguanylate cyclase [Vibrio tubiashii]MCG9688314.1 diguanylate cyclase [Vibrio tubiashii]